MRLGAATTLLLLCGACRAGGPTPSASAAPVARLAAWPDDPCGVLTAAQVGERDAARYHADRAAYFTAYRGSARPVPDVGIDAWMGGGAALRVLARDDLYFAVAVQMLPAGARARRSDEVLIPLARAVLARLEGVCR